MKPNKLWTLAILLFAGLCIFQYIEQDFSKHLGLFDFFMGLVTSALIVILVGIILGLLTALLPFRKKTYREKFKITLPLGTSLGIFVLLLNFGYLAYLDKVKGIKLFPVTKYDKVEIPLSLDCSTVHNGKFEIENLIIERKGNRQIQTRKDTKETREYQIEWLSDCEYYLTSDDKPTEKLKVKIVSVTNQGFDCYAAVDKYGSRFRYKRVK